MTPKTTYTDQPKNENNWQVKRMPLQWAGWGGGLSAEVGGVCQTSMLWWSELFTVSGFDVLADGWLWPFWKMKFLTVGEQQSTIKHVVNIVKLSQFLLCDVNNNKHVVNVVKLSQFG